MFCPKCGKADQITETYCRQCGEFLPDFDKKAKKTLTPEDHIKANTVLNLMSAIVSVSLAIWLYSQYLGKDDTPIIIYVTAGFLIAICGWQVQTFWRTLLLKKHFQKRQIETAMEMPNQTGRIDSAKTRELLNEADFTNNVPATVIENTTTKLGEKIKRRSS